MPGIYWVVSLNELKVSNHFWLACLEQNWFPCRTWNVKTVAVAYVKNVWDVQKNPKFHFDDSGGSPRMISQMNSFFHWHTKLGCTLSHKTSWIFGGRAAGWNWMLEQDNPFHWLSDCAIRIKHLSHFFPVGEKQTFRLARLNSRNRNKIGTRNTAQTRPNQRYQNYSHTCMWYVDFNSVIVRIL